VLTCVGWQVTLCDPIWQVTLRSCEMVYHEQLYQTFIPDFILRTAIWWHSVCPFLRYKCAKTHLTSND